MNDKEDDAAPYAVAAILGGGDNSRVTTIASTSRSLMGANAVYGGGTAGQDELHNEDKEIQDNQDTLVLVADAAAALSAGAAAGDGGALFKTDKSKT
jgi:hypothetical protein